MCVRVRVREYVCVWVCVSLCVFVVGGGVFMYVGTCMYVCVCVCVCVCMCVCVAGYVCVRLNEWLNEQVVNGCECVSCSVYSIAT